MAKTSIDRRLSRREFLRVAALTTTGTIALSGCAGSVFGSGTQSIVYWNLFGGGDGVRMVTMVNDFRKTHPNYKVKAVTLAWGAPYYTKLAMAAAGGRPPNVAISHVTRLPAYAPAGLLKPLDLNLLGRYGIGANTIATKLWDSAHYNGKLYAVPLDTHPFVMYYNTDICRKAGLLQPNGKLKDLKGPDEIIGAFKKAQQVPGVTWALALDTQDVQPWRLFWALYSQLGGKMFNASTTRLVMNDDHAKKAVSFMSDLTLRAKVAAPNMDYGGAVALFGSQKSAFHWNGEWEVTTFQDQKMPFDMTIFPNIFDSYKTFADSHTFVVPAGSTNDSAEQIKTNFEFISSMLKDSLTWARGGHIPAYNPVRNSAAYKKLVPQSHYAEEAKYVSFDPRAWFSGAGAKLEEEAGAAFQTVLSGQQTPQQAINQFSGAMHDLLRTPNPVQPGS